MYENWMQANGVNGQRTDQRTVRTRWVDYKDKEFNP